MQIKFNDSDQIYDITSFRQIGGDLIVMKGDNLPEENTSGFKLINGDRVTADYSEYTTKYNVLAPAEGVLMLSTGAVEKEDNPASVYAYTPKPEEIVEDVDPLSNKELTEAVADLMYDVSMMQLGL